MKRDDEVKLRANRRQPNDSQNSHYFQALFNQVRLKMSNDDLKNAILHLTQLISHQQQPISALQRTNGTTDGSEKIIESLANRIQEFDFDPDGPIIFNDWYARYEDVFKEDGRRLDYAAK